MLSTMFWLLRFSFLCTNWFDAVINEIIADLGEACRMRNMLRSKKSAGRTINLQAGGWYDYNHQQSFPGLHVTG